MNILNEPMYNELDELISKYIDGEAEMDDIFDFCFSLEPTAENKKMLTDCIICYDIDVLYEALFNIFGDMLTEDERIKYKTRFKSIFDQALYSDEE